jgi:hypothetical protein
MYISSKVEPIRALSDSCYYGRHSIKDGYKSYVVFHSGKVTILFLLRILHWNIGSMQVSLWSISNVLVDIYYQP